MAPDEKTPLDENPADGGNTSIDRPRLTPQGRTSPDPQGTDATSPSGDGAKQGQSDKAEG